MRKFLSFLISLALGFGAFWLITGNIGWEDIVQVLSLFQSWQGLVIFLLTLLIAGLHISRWQFILESQTKKPSFRQFETPKTGKREKKSKSLTKLKLADIWTGGFAISYLTPIAILGGEIFLSFNLKNKFPSIPLERNIASIAILRILNFSITFIILLLGLLSFLVLVGFPPERVILISGSVIIVLGTILAVFYYHSFRKKSILKIFLRAFGKKIILEPELVIAIERELFSFFKPKNKAMWKGLWLTSLVFFANFARFWFIIFFLKGVFINIFEVLAIFAFVILAYIVPFPAALGSLEASQAFVFGSFGLGAEVGTAFSLILRGAELSLAFIGLFFLARLWLKFRVFSWLLEKFAIFKKQRIDKRRRVRE